MNSIRRRRAHTRVIAAAITATLALATAAVPAQAHPLSSASCVSDRYGRMFPTLPPAHWSDGAASALGAAAMSGEEADPTPETEIDAEDNEALDAGYTYVGQFIDHDITNQGNDDDLVTPLDPSSVKNTRTPSLDLDSLYGEGPAESPDLYAADGYHLAVGKLLTGSTDKGARDLPRAANGKAYVGDPRNDENRIVGGLHSVMIRFHNKQADRVRKSHPHWSTAQVLKETQRQVRNTYQWAVLTDFLPQTVGKSTMNSVMPNIYLARLFGVNLRSYQPCIDAMPVEFSVAAYRFGHSQVRALYRINGEMSRVPVFSTTYMDASTHLSGFSPAPSNYGIDWSYFFAINDKRKINQPQQSYKLDSSLVYPLSLLPLPTTGLGPADLAKRNLMRSEQLGLPSGQDVARQMGIKPLRDDQILIGKATGESDDAQAITDVSLEFAGNAPLWTYVLAESTAAAYPVSGGKITGPQRAPMRMGPVGGRIVAETFVGLAWADQSSVLHDLSFTPDPSIAHFGTLGFKEIIEYATS